MQSRLSAGDWCENDNEYNRPPVTISGGNKIEQRCPCTGSTWHCFTGGRGNRNDQAPRFGELQPFKHDGLHHARRSHALPSPDGRCSDSWAIAHIILHTSCGGKSLTTLACTSIPSGRSTTTPHSFLQTSSALFVQISLPSADRKMAVPDGNVAKGAKIFKTKCSQCHTCKLSALHRVTHCGSHPLYIFSGNVTRSEELFPHIDANSDILTLSFLCCDALQRPCDSATSFCFKRR